MLSTLATLPPELHIKLFEQLDPDTSACLGLTCTAFYAIHEEVQLRLNKHLLCERLGPFQPSSKLPVLLDTWVGSDLVYGYPYTLNFVTHKRLVEVKREWVPWLLRWTRIQGSHVRFRATFDWETKGPARTELAESLPMPLTSMKEFTKVSGAADMYWDLELFP